MAPRGTLFQHLADLEQASPRERQLARQRLHQKRSGEILTTYMAFPLNAARERMAEGMAIGDAVQLVHVTNNDHHANAIAQALKRLELLLHHSGGIYSGDDLAAQLRLRHPRGRSREREMVTLRFCCQGWCFAFVREGLQRYPIEHTPTPRMCWSPAAAGTPIPIRWNLTYPVMTSKAMGHGTRSGAAAAGLGRAAPAD